MKKKTLAFLLTVVMLFSALIIINPFEKQEYALSNPAADENTQKLFSYMVSLKNEYVLSAQQESTWMGSPDYETDYIYKHTGELPAIKGFDYMNDDFDGVNERAIAWHKKGGIVTICHHCGSDFSGEWKDCMQDEVENWENMLTEGTKEYKQMIKGMDKAAEALGELQKEGIPVLWRPFHEFDGNWFWWSKGGNECFKKMWQIMYDRYTNYHKLNNLIWVLGFSDQGEKSRQWYPGDEYSDIIGADTYQLDLFGKLYRKMKGITNADKLICLHECGKNPTADELDKYPYSWFMTWHTEYLTDNNSPEELKELYGSEFVITLDEIGDIYG